MLCPGFECSKFPPEVAKLLPPMGFNAGLFGKLSDDELLAVSWQYTSYHTPLLENMISVPETSANDSDE